MAPIFYFFFALMYGGRRHHRATPLSLHFIPRCWNYCACLTHGRGNCGIMAQGGIMLLPPLPPLLPLPPPPLLLKTLTATNLKALVTTKKWSDAAACLRLSSFLIFVKQNRFFPCGGRLTSFGAERGVSSARWPCPDMRVDGSQEAVIDT